MTNLSALGEFGIIERFTRSANADSNVVVGVGDDAAVVRWAHGELILATDLLVEGRHFLRDAIEPRDLGYKALAVNASDIAAMGGVPDHILVSLGLPADADVALVDGLHDGFREGCSAFGVTMVGGDTTGSERIVVNVAIVGHFEPGTSRVTRSGARIGDLLCVTNSLGAADGGLRLILAGRQGEFGTDGSSLLSAHLRPLPRLAEGVAAARLGATAMIDVSDGLLADLAHICEAGGVGAEVLADAIPVASGLSTVASALGFDPLECALAGGEDYELLLAVPPDRFDQLRVAIESSGSTLTSIGRINAGDSVTLIGATPPERSGWDHFVAGSRG